MQKIVPHLWFDKEAVEATEFYASAFPNSKVDSLSKLNDTPSGDCDVVAFTLMGQEFMAISAGPYFKFNPSISFTVSCESIEEVKELWDKLSPGGEALMELGEYPFSPMYGWIQDKYGVSWQIIFFKEGRPNQRIIPHLMFTGDVCGKAEEAINLYASIFPNSKVGEIWRYQNQPPDKDGTVTHAFFELDSQEFGAMDSSPEHGHKFKFNEAISFMVNCKDQEEIDYYWEKLSADPETEQCGWLKDKFGVSWQVIPENLEQMLRDGTEDQKKRVTEAFLKMKKFNLAELEKAYKGE